MIGIVEGEDDFYYVCITSNGNKGYYSCVGAFESLLGKLERYEILDNVFELNNGYKTQKFLIEKLEK